MRLQLVGRGARREALGSAYRVSCRYVLSFSANGAGEKRVAFKTKCFGHDGEGHGPILLLVYQRARVRWWQWGAGVGRARWPYDVPCPNPQRGPSFTSRSRCSNDPRTGIPRLWTLDPASQHALRHCSTV